MSRSNRKQRTKQALRSKHRKSAFTKEQYTDNTGRSSGEGDSLMQSCALCWDKVAKTDMQYGTAWRITGNICNPCVDYVGEADWIPGQAQVILDVPKTYNYTNVSDWDWNDVYDSPSGAIQRYGARTSYVTCHHHMAPFSFEGLDNTYTVHLSGSSHLSQAPGVPELPTVGVYLDEGWFRGRLATNSGVVLDLAQPECLYVGWQDFGTVELDLLDEAVGWVLPYVYDKKSVIEIACIGGHGRTGSFLAALMIREGWTATDAIGYIRGGYCTKAVESLGQEDMLEQYEKKLKGVDIHEDSNKQLR